MIRQRFPTYANYSVTIKDILCDFPDLDELRNSSVARFLRDVGLRHIWQHRNSVVYSVQQPDTLCIFKAKVKQKVQTEFQIAKISGKLEKFQRRLDAPQLTDGNMERSSGTEFLLGQFLLQKTD